MKTQPILLAAVLMVLTYSSKAAIWTVSNHNVDSANTHFSELQKAIDSASSWDTIYVHGSTEPYGAVTITRPLTLIGAGYHPNNQFQMNTEVSTIYLEIARDEFDNVLTNPSGTNLLGMDIHSVNPKDDHIDDIFLSRNKLAIFLMEGGSSYFLTNWIITNNVISNFQANNNSTNFMVANNILTGSIKDFSSTSVLIKNNVFISNSRAFWNIKYAIISNNIFYGANTRNCDYCTFNNNIAIGSDHTTFLYDHNTGSGNLVDANPMFTLNDDFAYDFEDDYHLQAGSPGKNAGTDGTEIGIYGGTYPFPGGGDAPYMTSPMPELPQIMEMNILKTALPVGDTLKVRIKARNQD